MINYIKTIDDKQKLHELTNLLNKLPKNYTIENILLEINEKKNEIDNNTINSDLPFIKNNIGKCFTDYTRNTLTYYFIKDVKVFKESSNLYVIIEKLTKNYTDKSITLIEESCKSNDIIWKINKLWEQTSEESFEWFNNYKKLVAEII